MHFFINNIHITELLTGGHGPRLGRCDKEPPQEVRPTGSAGLQGMAWELQSAPSDEYVSSWGISMRGLEICMVS